MPLIPFAPVGATPHQRLLGHVPAVLTPWRALEEALYAETLDPALLEQVRRALAQEVGCAYCIARGGSPTLDTAPRRTQRAVAYAVHVARRTALGEAELLTVLGDEFPPRDVAALTAFVCFTLAAQLFGATLGLEADAQCDLPNDRVA